MGNCFIIYTALLYLLSPVFHSTTYEVSRSGNILSLFLHMRNMRLRGAEWLCPRPQYWEVVDRTEIQFVSLFRWTALPSIYIWSFSSLRVGVYPGHLSDGIYLSVWMTWGTLHGGHMFEELISQEKIEEGVTTRSCLRISAMDYLVGSNLQHKLQRSD